MGLFRSKGKGHSDNLPADPPGDYSALRLQNENDPNYGMNNISNIPPIPSHQFNNDSGYSGSYTNSNVSSNMSNTDNRTAQKPPRTTIVTTTTTTTTTTTVDSDGSTHTQVQPYDPSTDPPPASETTITSSTQPGTNDNVNNNTEHTTVRRNSTSGGRPIPPRSELRNSQVHQPQTPTQAQIQSEYQTQSEYQPQSQYQPPSHYQAQSQYQPSPLSSHPLAPPPLSPTGPSNGQPYDQPSSAAYQNEQSEQAYQTPSYPTQTGGPSPYSPPSPLDDPHTHHSKRESLITGMKALHGAGEALRGTVNSKIAGRLGDEQDAANQRGVREQGLREVRETGLRDRVPPVLVHGGKLRKRSLSRGLGEERRRPLERVDESGVNF